MKVVRLRFYPKTEHNGFPCSIISICMHPHLSTFFELLWTPPGITPLPPTGRRTRWNSACESETTKEPSTWEQTERKYISGPLKLDPHCSQWRDAPRLPVARLVCDVELGQERGLTFTFACLLSLCHLGLLSLYALMAQRWHSPTRSRTQQVRSSLDVLIHGNGQARFTASYTATLGGMVSDVQHSILRQSQVKPYEWNN